MAFRRTFKRRFTPGRRRFGAPLARAKRNWVTAVNLPCGGLPGIMAPPEQGELNPCAYQESFLLWGPRLVWGESVLSPTDREQSVLNSSNTLSVKRIIGDIYLQPTILDEQCNEEILAVLRDQCHGAMLRMGFVKTPVDKYSPPDGTAPQLLGLVPDLWDFNDYADGEWIKVLAATWAPRENALMCAQTTGGGGTIASVSGGGGTLIDGSGTIASISGGGGIIAPNSTSCTYLTAFTRPGRVHFRFDIRRSIFLRESDALLMVIGQATMGPGTLLQDSFADGWTMHGGVRLLLQR